MIHMASGMRVLRLGVELVPGRLLVRLFRLFLSVGLLALLLACGGGGRRSSVSPSQVAVSPFPSAPLVPHEAVLNLVLVDLEALPTPQGVQEALFSQLKSALTEALQARGVSKLVSKPPTGEANRVGDLRISGTQLTWSYKNGGDYNQDGIVSILDITPLAVHFNETAGATNEWIDGNADTVINILDITPLAANFMTDLARYAVESGATPYGDFTEVDSVPFSSATGEGRRRFSYELTIARDTWIRVVPYDGAENEGEPSVAVYFPPLANQPPVAELTADPTSGNVPLSVDFDASGSTDPDGSIAQYDYDWEGDGTYDLIDGGATPSYTYTLAGDYDATVRVTDDESATDTASILITATSPGNDPPVAALTADPTEGSAPLMVDFDAGGSYDPDNDVPPNRGIVLFEWDFEGDGTYDEQGTSGTTSFTYTEPSVVGYNATVRVKDANDATSTDSVVIAVFPGGEPPNIESVTPLSGMEGTQVTFTATVTGTPPYSYFWEFPPGIATPDYVEDYGETVTATVTLGPPGNYTMIVNVANLDGAHERDFPLTIYAPGEEWSIYTIEGSRDVTYSSLAIVDGNPAISYFDSGAQDLYYAYSENTDGTGVWNSVVADSKGMGMGDVGMYCCLAEVGGKPAISYYEGGIDNNLKFAINPDADGSGTWTTGRVDTAGDCGWITSIAEVDGRPAVGYFYMSDDETVVEYRFAINSAADGSGSWKLDPVADVNSGLFADGRVLRILDGRPAVAFYNWNDSELQFAMNANADGSGAWSVSTVDDVTSISLFVSVAGINGLPAIAYRNFDVDGLDFAMNPQADGSGTWATYQVDPGTLAWYAAVADIGGFPAIAYVNYSDGSLHYALSEVADGSGNWNITQVDTNASFVSLIEVAGRAAIAYAKTDTGDLMYALRNW